MPTSLRKTLVPLSAILLLYFSANGFAAFTIKSSSWWGDVSNPDPNHVDATVDGVTPDATVTGSVTFTLTCNLPSPTTLQLNTIVIQIDGQNMAAYYGQAARDRLGIPQTFTFNTALFLNDGWHEIRGRCIAQETNPSSPDFGKETAVTNGHQVFLNNGNPRSDSTHSIQGIVDSHAWYDVDVLMQPPTPIDYVYVQIKNVHTLTDAPLSGTVQFTGKVWQSGPTTIDHWKLMVDGGAVWEYLHDPTQERTVPLDTTTLTNGQHLLQFHGHGIAPQPSGRQLAGQVEIPITVSNGTLPPVSSASDSFAGPLDPTRWTVSATAGSASASGGVLSLTPNVGNPSTAVYVTSVPSYTFVGSQASTKVLGVVDGSINNKFTLRAPGNQNEVGWYYEQGNLWAYWRANGNETDPCSVTYVPGTHVYWRVRQTGSSVYWETSDGVTYTQRCSTPTTNIPFPLSSVQVEFNVRAYGSGAASAAPANYSNLNQ